MDYYHRFPHGLNLYFRLEEKQYVIYNAQLERIWEGNSIEVLHDSVMFYVLCYRPRKGTI